MMVQLNDGRIKTTPAMLGFVRAHIGRALQRFEPRITRVDVSFRDLNGPRGGIDKECEIRAQLRDGSGVTAGVRDQDFYGAVRRAAAKLKGNVARTHNRRTRG